MTWEIGFVLGLAVVALIILATEKAPSDVVAISVAALLLVAGVLEPREGFAGFASPATVSVAAMFVLSAGLSRTGAVSIFGRVLERIAQRSMLQAQLAMMFGVGLLSAFLNNTAAVAILIPVVIGAATRAQTSPSRLLMPLSFASMFGGVCTLIGTSTNLLGSSIAEGHGQPAFGMFEFSKLGLVFFAAGTLYMLTVGRWLLPSRRDPAPLTTGFGLGNYVTDVELLPEAASVGRTIGNAPLLAHSGVRVLQLVRAGRHRALPSDDVVLEAGDVLRVLCRVEDIARLRDRQGISIAAVPASDEDLESEDVRLVEVIVPPSSLATGKIAAVAGLHEIGAVVLALRQRAGQLVRGDLGDALLRPGDALLLEIPRSRIGDLRRRGTFLVISELELPQQRPHHVPITIAIMVSVVVLAATGVLTIAVSAVAGATLMVLLGCLTPGEAYQAIDRRVLCLIAGMLALGAAMEKSGAARLLADGILSHVASLGPIAILSVLYLLTSLLTEVLSNNAAIALLAPIAIATAESLGIDARPLLIAVMFAASSSFMTPIGYQTNTMIYGPGRYKFRDFLRVGAPLNLIFWLLATLIIPQLWSF